MHMLDYDESFFSSLSDTGAKNEHHDNEMKNALASAAFYGTKNLASGEFVRRYKMCIDDDDNVRNLKGRREINDNRELEKIKRGTSQKPGTKRFDMGGELGLFDVSSHEGSIGFFVKQVKSGETLEATIIQESEGIEDFTDFSFLVTSNTPPSKIAPALSSGDVNERKDVFSRIASWRPSGTKWNSLFQKNEPKKGSDYLANAQHSTNSFWKTIIMADSNGNSFTCNISLKKKGNRSSDNSEVEDRVLVVLPCAPSLFGPTGLSNLVKNNGLVIEAEIRAPRNADEMGCNFGQPSDAQCGNGKSMAPGIEADGVCASNSTEKQDIESNNGIMQMVKRGECAFVEKIRNQHRQHDCKAVIVVNSERENIFVMSSGILSALEDNDPPEALLPPSVMVSKEDGQQIIDVIREYEAKNELTNSFNDGIFATLEIQPNSNTETHNIQWPVVRSSQGAVQVFASNGWGVQATPQEGKAKGTTEWQMFIFSHDGINTLRNLAEDYIYKD